MSGGAADAPLEQHLAFGLGQAAPDAVGLADGQCMRTALSDHRAIPAHLLGAQLALRTGPTALAVGVEEHGRVDASTKAVHLPIPDIGVRSW